MSPPDLTATGDPPVWNHPWDRRDQRLVFALNRAWWYLPALDLDPLVQGRRAPCRFQLRRTVVSSWPEPVWALRLINPPVPRTFEGVCRHEDTVLASGARHPLMAIDRALSLLHERVLDLRWEWSQVYLARARLEHARWVCERYLLQRAAGHKSLVVKTRERL